MSYTYINQVSYGTPGIWMFSSTDSFSTIIGSNYIGEDYSSTLMEGDILFMQYPSTIMGIFIVHFSSGNLFLIPNGSFNTTGTSGGNLITSASTETLTVYNGTSYEVDPIVWYGTATTTTGIATFYPTLDGTGTGTAIFNNILSVSALASNDTTSAIAYPFSSLKSIASNHKTVTINVGVGANLGALGGNTIANAPDGTTVYLTLRGN